MSPTNKKKLLKLRKKLDLLDSKLLNLLKIRSDYVKKVLSLKEYKKEIVDKKRINRILKDIKTKSIKKGIDPKIRGGVRQTTPDPFVEYFKDKKNKQTITVKIISSDSKGLIVKPEGSDLNFPIKKTNIAINAADTRTSRFTGGERIDCAIESLDIEKRKVTLSIKLLEEIEKKEALEKFGTSEGSGKSLPFKSLADQLKKKLKDNKK